MIIGIEGSGSPSWDSGDFTKSFVRRVLSQSSESRKYYFVGPGPLGFVGQDIIWGALSTIIKELHTDDANRLILVGYSRGAAYCMEICARLRRGVRVGAETIAHNVDVLVLFDAVARQEGITVAEKIPANVHVCYHAMRDPAAGSRHFFLNVGKEAENHKSTQFHYAKFFATHGAMGGLDGDPREEGETDKLGNLLVRAGPKDVPRLPVINAQQDRIGTIQVANWMWDRLKKGGVLPHTASSTRLAHPFLGSRGAGEPNKM